MTFPPIRPASFRSPNWEMQHAMEKNTTGPTIIFKAFRNIVLIDVKIVLFSASFTPEGTNTFINTPITIAAIKASIVCNTMAWGFFCTVISTRFMLFLFL